MTENLKEDIIHENIINIDGLSKSYGFGENELTVLKNLSVKIKKGELVSIVGPSGAGKSTLLNIIGCLDGYQQGDLILNGKNLTRFGIEDLAGFRNRNIGFIFQMHNLLPEFTAIENVMIPLLMRRMSKKKARQKALETISYFGLENRINHKPTELSGGECQRIAVARAIVGDPEIILADEPTGSLDSANSKHLTDILFNIGKERNCTIVIVTHDKGIASLCQRTITLVDGRIVGDELN